MTSLDQARQQYNIIYDENDENKPSFEEWAQGQGINVPAGPSGTIQGPEVGFEQPSGFGSLLGGTTGGNMLGSMTAQQFDTPVQRSPQMTTMSTPQSAGSGFASLSSAAVDPLDAAFEASMKQYPGLYSEADRGQWKAAHQAQLNQNAADNAKANTLTPQQQAAADAAKTTAQQSGLGGAFDMGGTGPKSPTPVPVPQQPASGGMTTGGNMFDPGGPNPVGQPTTVQPGTLPMVPTTGYVPPPLDPTPLMGPGTMTGGPTTGGAHLPTTPSAPTGPKAGSAAYDQLTQMWSKQGGAPLTDPASQAAFNQWAGQVTSQFGVQNWEDLPADFSTRYNPNGGAPKPSGTPQYTPAVATPVEGANYNQNQNASQGGSFQTGGNTTANQTQNQTGQSNTNQQTTTGGTNQQSQTGQTTGTQTGSTTTTGTQQQLGGQSGTTTEIGTQTGLTTAKPIDTLGFGDLLKGQAGGVGASDAARSGFLQDVMQTGGTQFGSQVDQAVRNSLTGPQMTGAGDSARARAAGYAGAQVGRNNMDQRLGAAQQLAGPTGLATLSSAANPYIGQQTGTSGTATNTGTNNSTNFSNLTSNQNVQSLLNSLQNSSNQTTGSNTGFSNLTGSTDTANQSNTSSDVNENNSGTATGQSSQAASGLIPQSQQVSGGGGGCVLCTAATHLGLFHNLRVLRQVIDFKLRRSKNVYHSAARGYFFLFTPLAYWLLGRPRVAAILYPLAKAVVYEELRLSGRRVPVRWWAKGVHDIGHWVCHFVGLFPVSGRVTNATIESIARKNGIWFVMEDKS